MAWIQFKIAMNTIGTNTTKGSVAKPELIKDAPDPKLSGVKIGELVGGKNAKPAEKLDLAAEEAHWRANHAQQPYSGGRSFEEFGPAYKAGYLGFSKHGTEGKSFEETESKLRERYETENGSPKLPWTVVRPAVHAAWHRVGR